MLKTVAISLLLLVSTRAHACGGQGSTVETAGIESEGCVSLLQRIRSLDMKASWELCNAPTTATAPQAREAGGPPLPPTHVPDAAHCRLLDPGFAEVETCLVGAISLVTEVTDPRCPRFAENVAVGDLAFFVLVDRHPWLWKAALPRRVSRESAAAYQSWVTVKSNRAELKSHVAEALSRRQ